MKWFENDMTFQWLPTETAVGTAYGGGFMVPDGYEYTVHMQDYYGSPRVAIIAIPKEASAEPRSNPS